jgi:multidrug efflux pump subunit AcrA (membrane-fusion protein)
MFGRVTLSLGVIDRFVVPDRAVVKQAGSNERYVFVYNSINKTVDRKVVVLGRRIDTKYELLTNLDRNAQVVVAGHTQLVDGNKVNVQDTDKK